MSADKYDFHYKFYHSQIKTDKTACGQEIIA